MAIQLIGGGHGSTNLVITVAGYNTFTIMTTPATAGLYIINVAYRGSSTFDVPYGKWTNPSTGAQVVLTDWYHEFKLPPSTELQIPYNESAGTFGIFTWSYYGINFV